MLSCLQDLADLATRKADRFTFRPHVPLFLPGEPLTFVFEPAEFGVAFRRPVEDPRDSRERQSAG